MTDSETSRTQVIEQDSPIETEAPSVLHSRAASEVQAAVIMAKKYPRDSTAAYNRIIDACKRPKLAESGLYVYPRGGQRVEGPSIRLAEAIAQNWGNMDFGVIELEQRDGESTMMAYAWDLEQNTRQTKVFTVRHERHTKDGVTELTDPRDVYEMNANQAARRMRACVLGVIPGDIVEAAEDQVRKTLAGGSGKPLMQRVRSMVAAFGEMGVSQQQIEYRIGHKIDSTLESELADLRKIYTSLKDGMAKPEQYFSQPQSADDFDDAQPETETTQETDEERLAREAAEDEAARAEEAAGLFNDSK